MASTILVKCVICQHRWHAPLTSEMPMCPKCLGPVTVTGGVKIRKETASGKTKEAAGGDAPRSAIEDAA